MGAFRAFRTFTRGTDFKAWFYRILTNCCYERHRTAQHRPRTEELDEAGERYLYHQTQALGVHQTGADPAQILFDRISVERINEAIGRLSDEYRTVAMLYFLEGYSYQEIADMLDIPVGTVRSRLHRARRMLQKALWQLAGESGIIDELTAPPNPVMSMEVHYAARYVCGSTGRNRKKAAAPPVSMPRSNARRRRSTNARR